MEETLQPINSSSNPNPKQAISGSSVEKSFESLPNELIIEILTWLPAKTLLRFRCVSKSWRAVISTMKFIKSQLKKSSFETRYFPLAPVFFGDEYSVIEAKPVEDPFINSSKAPIVAAANGIVCINVEKDFYFRNPTIRKYKELPRFRDLPKERGQIQALFGYNQEKWIAVYSGNTNKWRRIHGFVGGMGERYFLLSGKIYWGKGTSEKAKIHYFDLKTGTCGMLQQPKHGKGSCDMVFGVLQYDLAVCCYHRTSHVNMWIMKENGGKQSWTRVLLVPKYMDPCREMSCQPVFMSKDGKILFGFWKLMALSDPKTKSVTCPCVNRMGEPWLIEVVVDSLVLVNDHDAKGPVSDPDTDDVVMIQLRL
ncbi:OLC1v1019467C1 [Oldenlandia corymbosa var. corymbosa]|uniref:OLC1v1019467C1 n=1 Tax=Oldenlandia corymbosa var. corymbosa TaxID=529605 RepID=A0AAV1EE52_OLDCO|nr:OLC1v1019467C1 [Oldenlandia corymbosa var. corymbosa]